MFFSNPQVPMPPMPQQSFGNAFSMMPMQNPTSMVPGAIQGGMGGVAKAGLLNRLLGGFGLQGGGGQPLNIMSMIDNTQKVIGIVQNVTPMVQQYGPLIRNIPSIYKMLKDSPSVNEITTDAQAVKPATIKEQTNEQHVEIAKPILETSTVSNTPVNHTVQESHIPKSISGIPAPKMYV